MNEPLQPIEHMTMADLVELRLQDYFEKNKLQPGDPIPKETELAETLGVSRNVVREALSRFRMLGMIESKKRRGMIITMPDVLSGLQRVLNPHLLDQETNHDLFELRLVIEMGIADLLFVKKKEEDIRSLEAIVERENNADSEEERVECDVIFHGTLYHITGNNLLKRFQKMLRPVFEYVVQRETEDGKFAVRSEVTHTELVRVLKEGTPAEYRKKMYEHLKPKFEHLDAK